MNKPKTFYITIDNKKVKCEQDQTILEAAQNAGIEIPALCYHSDVEIKANCRVCVVEIKGHGRLQTSCSTPAEKGMVVKTNSERVNKTRKTNLELLYSQHEEKCENGICHFNCEIARLARKYKIDRNKYPNRKSKYPVYKFGPSIRYDSSKCIDCRNCVDICKKQAVNFFDVKEKGHLFQVVPTKDKKRDCIYCGQCIVHCPVGAIETVFEFQEVEKAIKDKNKIVVFQFAPSIRVSIGEEFGMDHGSVVTDQLSAAIRKVGADKVFDVSVGADFTTQEEASELVERIVKKKPLPMFTSCCPAWVKFLEFNYPELIPNLTTTRSPHVLMGGIIKKYWTKKAGVNPKKVVVVSVMPCTAKKYEVRRKEVRIDGKPPVDYVISTRELAYMIKKKGIDLSKIKPEKADNPLGVPSGAGVIYGASGGVTESALRTAYKILTGKNLKKLDFKQVRGDAGCKEAEIKIKNKKIKIAVVNGMENAHKLVEVVKKNPKKYHFIEVMSCFGGCIGGGGQPVPTNEEVRRKRIKALYTIDSKNKTRTAHQNPILDTIYKEFLTDKKIIHKIAHTHYSKKKKENNF